MYSKTCKKVFILKFDMCASVSEEPNKVHGHRNTVNSSKKNNKFGAPLLGLFKSIYYSMYNVVKRRRYVGM